MRHYRGAWLGTPPTPLQATPSAWQNGRLLFSGSHDRYGHLPDKPRHERRIVMATAGCREIHDLITGNTGGKHQALSCIHLDPQFSVRLEKKGVFVLTHAEAGLPLRLTVTCGSAARIKSGYHLPEFGLARENNVICVQRTGAGIYRQPESATQFASVAYPGRPFHKEVVKANGLA